MRLHGQISSVSTGQHRQLLHRDAGCMLSACDRHRTFASILTQSDCTYLNAGIGEVRNKQSAQEQLKSTTYCGLARRDGLRTRVEESNRLFAARQQTAMRTAGCLTLHLHLISNAHRPTGSVGLYSNQHTVSSGKCDLILPAPQASQLHHAVHAFMRIACMRLHAGVHACMHACMHVW